jgi:hypothetical protein
MLEWCDPGMSYDKGKKDCFKCGIGKYRSLDDTGCQDCPSGATYTLTAKSRSECRGILLFYYIGVADNFE